MSKKLIMGDTDQPFDIWQSRSVCHYQEECQQVRGQEVHTVTHRQAWHDSVLLTCSELLLGAQLRAWDLDLDGMGGHTVDREKADREPLWIVWDDCPEMDLHGAGV